ncbi:MAG: hypothetical protein D3926_17575 [Desulfobacteraceae bacterium]|nr:MAG: hypothetical protein D3926_17575 [Desulfobacteraceae bacterium]
MEGISEKSDLSIIRSKELISQRARMYLKSLAKEYYFVLSAFFGFCLTMTTLTAFLINKSFNTPISTLLTAVPISLAFLFVFYLWFSPKYENKKEKVIKWSMLDKKRAVILNDIFNSMHEIDFGSIRSSGKVLMPEDKAPWQAHQIRVVTKSERDQFLQNVNLSDTYGYIGLGMGLLKGLVPGYFADESNLNLKSYGSILTLKSGESTLDAYVPGPDASRLWMREMKHAILSSKGIKEFSFSADEICATDFETFARIDLNGYNHLIRLIEQQVRLPVENRIELSISGIPIRKDCAIATEITTQQTDRIIVYHTGMFRYFSEQIKSEAKIKPLIYRVKIKKS